MITSTQPHSAHLFGPPRDFWWHSDFLDLMAGRWRLREAASLADVGCGLGHWSRLLYRYLRTPARLAAIDREPRWVDAARENFRRAFPLSSPERQTFAQGDATKLPLPDNTFDVVTCQTVLMHLADPAAALREMQRILRSGGLLICVEPNNLWNLTAFTSLTAGEPVEVLARRFEFWVRYHRGKQAAGEGDNNIGDQLPGLFEQAGLTEILVHQSDRAAALFPPYSTPAQQALIEQEKQWRGAATGPWDREDLHRHVVGGGGGTEEFFERAFGELIEKSNQELQAIDSGVFHAGFGGVTYLVSGRKQ